MKLVRIEIGGIEGEKTEGGLEQQQEQEEQEEEEGEQEQQQQKEEEERCNCPRPLTLASSMMQISGYVIL